MSAKVSSREPIDLVLARLAGEPSLSRPVDGRTADTDTDILASLALWLVDVAAEAALAPAQERRESAKAAQAAESAPR